MISIIVKKTDPNLLKVAHTGKSALAPFEMARLQDMHISNQAAFVTGRLTLRSMLGDMLEMDPKDVPLSQEGAGRVTIDTSGFEREPYFSVSHTGESNDAYVAVAVSTVPLGIDLDCYNRKVNWQRIVERHFHQKNKAFLADLKGAAATRTFFQFWTLAEALVKLEDGKLLPYLHGCAFDLAAKRPKLMGESPKGQRSIGFRNYCFGENHLMFGLAFADENMEQVPITLASDFKVECL